MDNRKGNSCKNEFVIKKFLKFHNITYQTNWKYGNKLMTKKIIVKAKLTIQIH